MLIAVSCLSPVSTQIFKPACASLSMHSGTCHANQNFKIRKKIVFQPNVNSIQEKAVSSKAFSELPFSQLEETHSPQSGVYPRQQ
jgi:hypothetical protein